jgi:hypothetical protein
MFKGKKKFPDSIEFYNTTEYRENIVDEMARKYSVKVGLQGASPCILQHSRCRCYQCLG